MTFRPEVSEQYGRLAKNTNEAFSDAIDQQDIAQALRVDKCKTHSVIHNKLVRDRIPDIITAAGKRPVSRIVTGDELLDALLAKLHEEGEELRQAVGADRAEELADLFEVIRGLAHHLRLDMDQLTEIANNKRSQRGGFEQGVWLETVDNP